MLLSFFLLLLAQDVAPAQTTAAASDLSAAIELAESGRNAEALAAMQKIVAANPEDHLARLWIANVHMRMGHPELAEPVYRSIVVEDADNVDAWVGLGSALLHQDRIVEALDALTRAEQIAPENAKVVGALASAYQLAGDDRRSIEYRQRVVTMSPTTTNLMLLEDARRAYGHRVEAQAYDEDFSSPTPSTRVSDIAINFRLSDVVRLIGRAELQTMSGHRENLDGGGVAWRWTPWGTFTGQALIGNDNLVLPQGDYLGRVDYGYRRATWTGQVRYYDFFGATVLMLSPGVTVTPTPRWTVGLRYALTSTDYATVTGVRNNTFDVRIARELAPRIWARGAFVRGVDNFENFTIEEAGEFHAKTAGAALQILLPSLTSIVGSYDYQWRKDDVRMGRAKIALVQGF
ncbi:MAG TPA: tetratricopeptide repeat protein [Vicinamibacterales bacterium]|nr:tetratricopeptide repeat protein [Vicinamibacterales bacterium]